MQPEVMAPKNLHQTQITNPETAPKRKTEQRLEENKNNVEHRGRAMTCGAEPGRTSYVGEIGGVGVPLSSGG